MGGQWNKYPGKAHFVRCLSDLGSRKSNGRDSISETGLGFLPGNDRRGKVAEKKMQFLENAALIKEGWGSFHDLAILAAFRANPRHLSPNLTPRPPPNCNHLPLTHTQCLSLHISPSTPVPRSPLWDLAHGKHQMMRLCKRSRQPSRPATAT